MNTCIARHSQTMMNHRYSDDIVQDTVGPPPMDPIDCDYSVASDYKSITRVNKTQTSRPAYVDVYAPPKTSAYQSASSDKLLIGGSFHRDAILASVNLTKPLHAKKTSDETYWNGCSAAPAGRKSPPSYASCAPKKAPPSSSSSLKKAPPSDGSTIDFADDSSYLELFRPTPSIAGNLKDSSHSTATSACPSFYSASFHTRASALSATPPRTHSPKPVQEEEKEEPASTPVHEINIYSSRPKTPPTPTPPQEEKPTPIEINIAPGVSAPLRGANETTNAVRSNYITRLTCWGCAQDVFCIADCLYVICPDCRTISPMEPALEHAHGLGLGLTRASLNSLQEECFGPPAARRGSSGSNSAGQ